jgi:RimJ/RimL family protein N-acetyltransferase
MAVHLGHWLLRGYGQWALVSRATGEFIARAGLWQPEGWPGLEVGWLLGRAHWGSGYATEAGQAALIYVFETVGADRVISLIQPDNTASIRAAERLGESYDRSVELGGTSVSIYSVGRG